MFYLRSADTISAVRLHLIFTGASLPHHYTAVKHSSVCTITCILCFSRYILAVEQNTFS